jgi:hypothetical protein
LLRLARRRAKVVAYPRQALGDAHTHLSQEPASDDLFISACGHAQADVQWRVSATCSHTGDQEIAAQMTGFKVQPL